VKAGIRILVLKRSKLRINAGYIVLVIPRRLELINFKCSAGVVSVPVHHEVLVGYMKMHFCSPPVFMCNKGRRWKRG
jgi:hypothetical protein